ncbi:hypothetical protein C8R44DRAFT_867311 [Mycena epipterygia]|nr:hypothetical protein C8R44DRAFT_867311 [Mycena epipterygia]
MSAQPQKPLLLPGIAPHLFQTRAAAPRQRKMLIKDSPDGPVSDHPRTPSDGSTVTVTAPTLDEAVRELQVANQNLQRRLEAIENATVGARLDRFWMELRETVYFLVWYFLLVSFSSITLVFKLLNLVPGGGLDVVKTCRASWLVVMSSWNAGERLP